MVPKAPYTIQQRLQKWLSKSLFILDKQALFMPEAQMVNLYKVPFEKSVELLKVKIISKKVCNTG